MKINKEIYAKRLEELRKIAKARGLKGKDLSNIPFFEVYKKAKADGVDMSPAEFGKWLHA